MNISGNTMLITGGGSGIGRRLAEEFQKLGNTVIIAGRREAILNAVVAKNPGMVSAVLDVEDPASIRAFAARMKADHPKLNVLINNAGIMKTEKLIDGEDVLMDSEATVVTNLLGPIRVTIGLLPQLREQSRATIINVSSGLAFVPLALAPTYCATKAGIHSYTLSLRRQLETAGVEVLELIPPAVQTDLTPGQSTRGGYMPLEEFISETMAIFQQQPTPSEIHVKRANFQRLAEAEGRFDAAFDLINPRG
jgi:uncharacterized oxidoreductase